MLTSFKQKSYMVTLVTCGSSSLTYFINLSMQLGMESGVCMLLHGDFGDVKQLLGRQMGSRVNTRQLYSTLAYSGGNGTVVFSGNTWHCGFRGTFPLNLGQLLAEVRGGYKTCQGILTHTALGIVNAKNRQCPSVTCRVIWDMGLVSFSRGWSRSGRLKKTGLHSLGVDSDLFHSS